MKAHVKIEGDVLEITFTGVHERDRGRMANIEIALLRALGGYASNPWVHPRTLGKPDHEGYLVQLVRGESTREHYWKAGHVLAEFCLDEKRCNFCRDSSMQCPDCAAEKGGYKPEA